MPNVVIVDDQATDRQILDRLVRNLASDLEVFGFGRPVDALAWLAEHQPDLILVDYRMPEMDGLAFLESLADVPSCTGIPVVVITIVDDAELRYRALEAGATDFLTKPLDLQECQARCRNLLTLRRQQLTIARHADRLASARRRISRTLRTLSVGNELLLGTRSEDDLLQGMCQVVTEEAGYPVVRIGLWDDAGHLHEVACMPVSAKRDTLALSRPEVARLAADVRESGSPRVLNEPAAVTDDAWAAWGRQLVAAGFQSAALLPLRIEGLVDGVIAVLAHAQGTFDADEEDLLTRLANNLGYGLAARRAQRARERAERDCRFLTHFDRLTGLPNRNRLVERLREIAEADDPAVVLLTVNLDRFKMVNNTTGHEAGDRVLVQVVRRLQAILSEADLLARQAGDEFLLLLAAPPAQAAERIEERAARTARRIIETLRRPVHVAGYDYYLGASIGIARVARESPAPQSTLRQAATAMRQAKDAGGNTHVFYTGDLTERHTRRVSLEGQLHRAIERDAFELHFQPIVELGSGVAVGVEALLRWPRDDGSLLGPDAFIPLAEETGLMERLGQWVFAAACRQARTWEEAGLDPYMSVNLSVHQLLLTRLPKDFAAVIRETGARPERLELEVTESAIMTDPGRTERILHTLHDRGIGIALDDFGIGYSSLSRLKDLPITTLKIDKDFVLGLPSDPGEHTIVRTMIQLADNLGVQAVAEGIETPEHRRILQSMGCRRGQGFHFCAPLPAKALASHLSRSGSGNGREMSAGQPT